MEINIQLHTCGSSFPLRREKLAYTDFDFYEESALTRSRNNEVSKPLVS